MAMSMCSWKRDDMPSYRSVGIVSIHLVLVTILDLLLGALVL